MKIFKKKLVETNIIEDIICNKCGKSLRSKYNSTTFVGLIDGFVQGSYFSDKLDDLVNYKFSICEECVSEYSPA